MAALPARMNIHRPGRHEAAFSKRLRLLRVFVTVFSFVVCARLIVAPLSGQAPAATAPRRIVSLVPATTEMLYAMKANDRLIAVGNYDHYPPDVERLPRVGGLLDPNTETILSLRPDLVIVYDTQDALKERLQRAGIAIYRYSHKGLPDITATMRSLGEAVGARAAAESAAAEIEAHLNAVRARVAGKPRPRTLLIFGREPGALRQINASAGVGFLHDVLEIAGGTDVLGDMQRQSVMLTSETILTRAPEVIIELHYGESLARAQIDAERRVWNALPSLPAVRNNRIYLLTGNEFVVPGPRIVLAAERFADVLHGR
jgi:iron complex transport system substrate-binding protein